MTLDFPEEGDTVRQFAANLATHEGEPRQATQVCFDMAPAYISGAEGPLPPGNGHLRPLPHYGAAQPRGR